MNNDSAIKTKINNKVIPKGILVAIGGNEDKEHKLRIFTAMMSLVKK